MPAALAVHFGTQSGAQARRRIENLQSAARHLLAAGDKEGAKRIRATAVGAWTSGFQAEAPGDVKVMVARADLLRADLLRANLLRANLFEATCITTFAVC